MPTYVAFLRAINLGATRKFPKADIIAATEAAGGTDVATHINTGNVLLTTSLRSRAKVEAALEAAYEADRGFAVPTIVFTPAELRQIAADADELARPRRPALRVPAQGQAHRRGHEAHRGRRRRRRARLRAGPRRPPAPRRRLPLGHADQRRGREGASGSPPTATSPSSAPSPRSGAAGRSCADRRAPTAPRSQVAYGGGRERQQGDRAVRDPARDQHHGCVAERHSPAGRRSAARSGSRPASRARRRSRRATASPRAPSPASRGSSRGRRPPCRHPATNDADHQRRPGAARARASAAGRRTPGMPSMPARSG